MISNNSLFRTGLALVMSHMSGFDLAGVAASLDELDELVEKVAPEVILLARDSNAHLQDELRSTLLRGSRCRVVELSMSDSDMTVYSKVHFPRATVADLAEALESME